MSKNWFFFGIAAVLVLGIFLPFRVTALNPDSVTSTAVIVALFLISGMTLPSESIRQGVKDYKLHFYVQGFIFILFPLFMTAAVQPLRGVFRPEVIAGFFALSCLPTTISSCIVFTQLSGGNVVGTMFNASLANIAGVVISPLILSWMLSGSGTALIAGEIGRILGTLGLKMLLPIIVGQGLRVLVPYVHKAAIEHKAVFRTVSNVLILLIILFAVSKTAVSPDFRASLSRMGLPFLFLAVFHLIMVGLAYTGGRIISLEKKSIISAVFTAPQKTVALGVPLISAYFADSPEVLGIALLPVVFYHSFQLITAGVLKSLPFFQSSAT